MKSSILKLDWNKQLRKMLILIAQMIVDDHVIIIKQSDVLELLNDEVTNMIKLICQLVSFVKYFNPEKGEAGTVFIDRFF